MSPAPKLGASPGLANEDSLFKNIRTGTPFLSESPSRVLNRGSSRPAYTLSSEFTNAFFRTVLHIYLVLISLAAETEMENMKRHDGYG